MEQLAKLFGEASRLKTLRLFVFNQDTAFAPPEVADRLKLSRGTARKEIAVLLSAGLLRKKNKSAPVRYQADPRFTHFEALETFIRDTTSASPQDILKALRRAGTLQLVALSGLFTGADDSQIDLLVVGDHLKQSALARAVKGLEAELGREIRYAFFATADFRYRHGVYDRLIRDVLDYPHRLLIDKIGL